jgi:hypothetical protein
MRMSRWNVDLIPGNASEMRRVAFVSKASYSPRGLVDSRIAQFQHHFEHLGNFSPIQAEKRVFVHEVSRIMLKRTGGASASGK